MNDYKIQLESKDDLAYLKQEFLNYATSKVDSASTVSESLKQQFFEKVFSIVTENVQVNGVDWTELTGRNSTMEAVNAELVGKLQDMQVETETLLRRVIQHRRQVPQELKQLYIAENDQMLAALEAEQSRFVELSPEELQLCSIDSSTVPDMYTSKLHSGLANLVHLQNTIPEIVAKLGRAQAVINEEGGRRADENTQILNRHRRLSRQFDLASKIGSL